MTDLDAFKFGFLLRCADEGLSPEETRERVKLAGLVTKQAAGEQAGTLSSWFSPSNAIRGLGLGTAAQGAYSYDPANVITGLLMADQAGGPNVHGLGAATLALGAGVGAGAGYLGAKATDQPIDPDEVKQQELVAAMRQHADRARRTAARIGYRMSQERQTKPRSPRLLSA